MSMTAMNTRATVIPCLRYRDAPKAIEWLCSVLGFEKPLVVLSDDGKVAHAQLSFGNGMVMRASVAKVDTEFGRLTRQPDEIGGMETQSPNLVVTEVDADYQRALAAGAHIDIDIRNDDYGGRRLQLPRSGRVPVERGQPRALAKAGPPKPIADASSRRRRRSQLRAPVACVRWRTALPGTRR